MRTTSFSKTSELLKHMKGIGQIQDVIVRELVRGTHEKFKYGIPCKCKRMEPLKKLLREIDGIKND